MRSCCFLFAIFFILLVGEQLPAGDHHVEQRLVWQPLQRYFIRRQNDALPPQGTRRLNSFNSYTHLGTDFGFHGPAEHEIEWVNDQIVVHLGQQPDVWAGMWHCLAGRARDHQEVLDFRRAYPPQIADDWQPRITQLMVDAGGRGNLKLEIKNAFGTMLWENIVTYYDELVHPQVLPIPSQHLRDAKLLVWTVEPGSEITVKGLFLGVELPRMERDRQAFVTSYAKLLRNHCISSGFTRDRAHLDAGAFDSIAATGLMVLSTAAAAQKEMAIVSVGFARETMRKTHLAVSRLKRVRGLLPHFVRREESGFGIHPNTEHSTVDTALYMQCLLLASRMLEEPVIEEEVLAMIRQIDIEGLRLSSGHLSHGLNTEGDQLLPHGWRDWGGETALVALLQRVARPGCAISPADHPGHAWQGTGFITEIQSLLHPDFASDEPDKLDGVQWLSARRVMLGAQRSYFTHAMPRSFSARLGFYGLSAGENEFGNSYFVGGVDLVGQKLIHPHYMLMSGLVLEKPVETLQTLERLEKAGFMPPWGLVENLTADGQSYLPMNGALNAAFEALGIYHFVAKNRGIPDRIYEASLQCPAIREAMNLFYPQAPAKGN